MTRRLADNPPRRLRRARQTPHRPPHGLDAARPTPAADQQALCALAEENALLARELGRVQARCTRWRDDGFLRVERLEAQLLRARAEVIVGRTLLAIARDGLAAPLRRALCVGGRARQLPVYRDLVERAGGEFAHVEGASVDCLAELGEALGNADLVILQAGYVCRAVCQAVESHCARSGIRCIHLDKACALGFAQALREALA